MLDTLIIGHFGDPLKSGLRPKFNFGLKTFTQSKVLSLSQK